MAEERRDQEQPEGRPGEAGGMEGAASPDAQRAAEEVAERREPEEQPGGPEEPSAHGADSEPEAQSTEEQPEVRSGEEIGAPGGMGRTGEPETPAEAGQTVAEVDDGREADEEETVDQEAEEEEGEEEEAVDQEGEGETPAPAMAEEGRDSAPSEPERERPGGGGRPSGVRPAAAAATGAATSTARSEPRPPRERRPSHRTTAREERRRRSQARRRRRRLIFGVLGGTVAAMLILGLILPDLGITPGATPAEPPVERETVGTETGVQDGDFIEPGAEHGGYAHIPPTSGPRYEEPAPWGAHEEEIEDEAVVRNLEMGGIAINHNLADPDAVQELRTFVEALPNYPGCIIMRPYAAIPEGTIVLTAWGWMHETTEVDAVAMTGFFESHRNQGPWFEDANCGYAPPQEEPTPTPEPTPDPDQDEDEGEAEPEQAGD